MHIGNRDGSVGRLRPVAKLIAVPDGRPPGTDIPCIPVIPMANRILAIDLTNSAKDFETVAMEQGWPLLDPTNTNCQILRKWLGPLVADPERKGNRVSFYVRNEHGARLDCPVVLPVTERELAKPFEKAFRSLVEKINKAEPKTAAERKIHSVVQAELKSLMSESRAADRRCYLFKYRDENDQWRIVWCPGFRRKDSEPASPIICTNPSCSQLFLRRSDGSQRCPACQVTPQVRKAEATSGGSKKPLWLALLLLLLIGGGLLWWWLGRDDDVDTRVAAATLSVTPEETTAWVGTQVEFVVKQTNAEGAEEDVTSQVVATVEDPKIAMFDLYGAVATAKALGETGLSFHLGDQSVKAKLMVKPIELLKVVIAPDSVVLGIGTTTRLKMMGESEGGNTVDLTNAAEWISDVDNPCFVYRGLLEGLEEGKCQVRARYRATPESEYDEATADVEVVDLKPESLTIAVDPPSVPIGQAAKLTALAITADGKRYPVSESSKLRVSIEPEEIVTLEGQHVHAQKVGAVTLSADFGGLTAEATVQVVESKVVPPPVTAESLILSVGEVADIPGVSPSPSPAQLTSTSPEIARISETNRVVGVSVGECSVEVVRGDQKHVVKVSVESKPFQSIAVLPSRVSVRVDDSAQLRVVANVDDATQVEIAPDTLEWSRFPRPDYADVDKGALTVTGVKATTGAGELLTVRFHDHEASAEVQVIAPPFSLELTPTGSLELPVGQQTQLQVSAIYENGRRAQVPHDRVEWVSDPVDGFTLQSGQVTAKEPNKQLSVSVRYEGQESNKVQIKSVTLVPPTLQVTASPSPVAVDGAGQLAVTATSPSGRPVVLDPGGLSFESGDESLLLVNPATGSFRAIAEGQVTVTARHSAASDAATTQVRIQPRPVTPTATPKTVRIVTDQPQPIVLPVGVAFDDFRVEVVLEDGTTQNVTGEALLHVQDDPADASVAIVNGRPVGVRPTRAIELRDSADAEQGLVQAEHGGVTSQNGLKFVVTADLDIDAIQLAPTNVTLAVNENTKLEAIGFQAGRRVGIITNGGQIEWRSGQESVAMTDGPTVTGLGAGTATVSAHWRDVVSVPATDVSVVDESPRDLLLVDPSRLFLRAGESIRIGTDIVVRRGGGDFSDEAIVVPASRDIVAYNDDSRTLQGVVPGKTWVTFVVGDQTATADIEVAPPISRQDARIVLEPSGGILAVGELLNLRALLITADGERVGMTASVVLSSSEPNVATAAGHAVQGQSPGDVQIIGRVPGVEEPGTARFQVKYVEFERLAFVPPRLDLSTGQRRRFQIYGVEPTGRRVLGPHPDLIVTADQVQPDCIELMPDRRQVLGLIDGRADLRARWRDQVEKTVPVHVGSPPLNGLVIRPNDATLTVGETAGFQAFVRRGRRLQPLSELDGVEFRIDDSSVASASSGLQVTGENPGTTRAVAQYAALQASARVRVTAPPTGGGPRSSGSGTPTGGAPSSGSGTPAGPPVGLRFIPNVFRLELRTPGDSIRVIRVYSDGSSEDVDHLATLTVSEPRDVIEIERTSSGPVIRPRKLGQTQVNAEVEGLRTETPLLVDVTDLPPRAFVEASPNPLRLQPGDTAMLDRVRVRPGDGRRPLEFPYQVTATPSPVIDVLDDGHTIHGKAQGSALAQVTIVDPNGKYNGEHTTVTVQVGTPPTQINQTQGARLELSGPSVTTVGGDVAFHVDLLSDGGVQDVTHDGATLVLGSGDDALATIRPGCRLEAVRPGTATLHARHGNLVSGSHQLRIDQIPRIRTLELEISPSLLAEGESRPYHVWGNPESGGPRVNLTRLITDDRADPVRPHIRLNVLEPTPGTRVAVHQPPNIVGREKGKVAIQAAIGDRVTSNRVEIEVIGGALPAIQLMVSPARITVTPGEITPPLTVEARTAGARMPRAIDPALVQFDSLDADVLAPAADRHGQFAGVRPGRTRIRARYNNLTATAEVEVAANRFKRVDLGKLTLYRDTFDVEIHIRADAVLGELEYRCLLPNQDADIPWKASSITGQDISVVLTTPQLRLSPSNMYRVDLETRDPKDRSSERYPLLFSLDTDRAAPPPESP